MPQGLHSSQVLPNGLRHAALSGRPELDFVDDTHNDRANRCFAVVEYLAGTVTLIEDQDGLTKACPDRIHCNDIAACRTPACVEALGDEQLSPFDDRVMDGRHNAACDAAEDHWPEPFAG